MLAATQKGVSLYSQTVELGLPFPDAQAALLESANDFNDRLPQLYTKVNTAQETFSQAAYGQAPTPDRVQSVVVPSGIAILAISFTALWKISAAATVSAAIFIGSNQLRVPTLNATGSPPVQEATVVAGAATGYCYLMSHRYGLDGSLVAGSDASIVTTGMIHYNTPTLDGGICLVYVTAGTYDISVQYKNSAGSLSIKERRLTVHATPYF